RARSRCGSRRGGRAVHRLRPQGAALRRHARREGNVARTPRFTSREGVSRASASRPLARRKAGRKTSVTISEDPEGHEISALAGRRVVEIGCGEGRLTVRYAADAASVLAIDPDADAIAALAAEKLTGVDARALGVEQLDLPPRSADIVLFAWSL